MTELESAAHLFGDDHVRSYLETNGEVGYRWREDAPIAILFTRGRTSGEERANPLIFGRDGDSVVLVASKGGSPEDPGWFRNLEANPVAEIQVMADRWAVRMRIAEGEERERLWRMMAELWPNYDAYAEKTDREIPVVVLERR